MGNLHICVTPRLGLMTSIADQTHRFLRFNIEHTGEDEDAHYFDLGMYLSQMNRRTYRQGMTYDVSSITFHDSSAEDTYIKVCTMPRTWLAQNAWKKGFTEWMKQQNAAFDATGIKAGAWHDFKIYLNSDMVADVDKPDLIDMEDNTFPEGDWDYSVFQIPQDGSTNPSESTIHMMGNNAGAWPTFTKISLLKEFEKTLNTPGIEDPDIPSTASDSVYNLLSAAQPDVDTLTAVVADIEDDNDFPPYSASSVPGAGTPGAGKPAWPWVVRETCIEGGGLHVARTGSVSAPCGLLLIETKCAEDENEIGVTIEVKAGSYKGVSARPMLGGGL